jgi:hypothetical protein
MPSVVRYCIALKNALFFRQPSGVELRRIFDKKQSAIGKWQMVFKVVVSQ